VEGGNCLENEGAVMVTPACFCATLFMQLRWGITSSTAWNRRSKAAYSLLFGFSGAKR